MMPTTETQEMAEGTDYWLSRPYLSADVCARLKMANVWLVPQEGFRDNDIRVFPVRTEEFFHYLRETLPAQCAVEIAINDEEYKEVALHSALLILGGIVVLAGSGFVLPVVVNVVSEYINRRLFSEREKRETTVRWELTAVDGSRAVKVSYEGPALDFQSEMQKAIASLMPAGDSTESPVATPERLLEDRSLE